MADEGENTKPPEASEDDEEDLFGTEDDPEPSTAGSGDAAPPPAAASTTDESAPAPPPEPSSSSGAVVPPTSSSAEAKKPGQSAESTGKTPAPASLTSPVKPEATIPKRALPTGTPGPRYGLPAGVTVPPSIKASLLQGRLLDTLKSLPVQLINDALTEYDDAVQIKGDSIRNHGAYLYGVIKRYVSVQERANSGEGAGILPMGPELTPAIHARLQTLVDSSFCTQEEMNEKVKSKIRMLSEKDAIFAIDELASVDRKAIRNFGSYFMGILNRYMRGDAGPNKKTQQSMASPPMNYGNRRQEFRPQDRYNDPRGGSRDDRYQHRGRDSESDYRRGRGAHIEHNEAYRRERSRDRYDNMDHRGDQPGWRDPYDNRQRPPPSQYQNRLPPPQGQYQQQPPPMGGGVPPPPPRQGMSSYGPPQQQNQQQYMSPAPAVPPAYSQQQPPQQQYMGGAPQQSSAYGPGPNNSGPPIMGGQQPPMQPYSQPVVQPPPYGGGPPPGGPMGVSQPPQQSYAPPPQTGPSRYPQQQRQPQQGRWQGNQQHPGGGPVDILGLADKAASAVQALQSQNQYPGNNLPPMGGAPQNSYGGGPQSYPGQAPPPGPPAVAAPFHQQQPPPQHHQNQRPPPYGQQNASSSYNSGYRQPPNSQYQQPPPTQQQHYQGQPPRNAGGQRRRTTASMAELPVTVQYAVHNLQATHQINGPLDEGMLGMVKDLPEDLALAALQKFSSIDKESMRNKTAYLAGVLRRELEKINRR